MQYIDFYITQKEKVLSSDKIVINKYDNKISRLNFNLDGSIPGRLYLALKNPITKKYFMTPLLSNQVLIQTNISVYPGLWKAILIGVQDDYEVVDNNIDQTKVTYVSDELPRIVVRDNFLSETDIEQTTNPVIDEMLDALRKAQEQLENAAIQAQEAANLSSQNLEQVKAIETEINTINSEIKTIYDDIKAKATEVSGQVTKIEGYMTEITEQKNYIDNKVIEFNAILQNITELFNQIKVIETDLKALKKEFDKTANDVTDNIKKFVQDAQGYVTTAKAYAIGDESIPESATNNSKYYAKEAKSAVASLLPKVEDAKKHIDDYVTQKESELKGETGDVYFAAFRVVNGRLKMFSDPNIDKVVFNRVGSRLKYRLKF